MFNIANKFSVSEKVLLLLRLVIIIMEVSKEQ